MIDHPGKTKEEVEHARQYVLRKKKTLRESFLTFGRLWDDGMIEITGLDPNDERETT